jgi:hypothetical protein
MNCCMLRRLPHKFETKLGDGTATESGPSLPRAAALKLLFQFRPPGQNLIFSRCDQTGWMFQELEKVYRSASVTSMVVSVSFCDQTRGFLNSIRPTRMPLSSSRSPSSPVAFSKFLGSCINPWIRNSTQVANKEKVSRRESMAKFKQTLEGR